MVRRPSGTMLAMRKFALLTLCLASLASACAPADSDPANAAVPEGKSPAQIQASFASVLQMQEDVLADTAELVARAESAAVEDLEVGMKKLNDVLLRGRQEVSYMRNLDTEEGKSRMEQLRTAMPLIRGAYDKLLAQHPDPTPEIMRVDDAPTQ